jgi:putative FmdB family regulatory protein
MLNRQILHGRLVSDMPLYEYECENCGIRFERRQPITSDPLKTCPECGGSVHRLIHPVGIIFKGKGFYVTDNRSKAKSSTAIPKTRQETKPSTSEKKDTAEKSQTKETSSSKSSEKSSD